MIDQPQMMRELIAYAHEEMRNRGIEEAARLIERHAAADWRNGRHYRELPASVRDLKRDPRRQLSDWYGPPFEVLDMVPIGA